MKRKIRAMAFVILDILIINLDILLALIIRFGFDFSAVNVDAIIKHLPEFLIIKLAVFTYFNFYKSLWKYASIDELLQIFNGVVVANTIMVSYLFLLRIGGFPRSVIVLIGLFDLLFIGGSRLSYRVLRRVKQKYGVFSSDKTRVLIIGAGEAGCMISKEVNSHIKLNSVTVAFLDDSDLKQSKIINGARVVGKIEKLSEIVEKLKIDQIIIALPSANKSRIKEIIDLSKETKCKVKILPKMDDILNSSVSIKNLREINIEDLLGREEVKLDIELIKNYIVKKTILVTGGGGSIGSEICRQVAKYSPRKLIIFDIYENNAYDIQNELLRKYKENINLDVVIGSVRDSERLEEIMKNNKVDLIFHAAAHKHVPLMERSPKEAVKNNVFGTKNVAETAIKYSVPKFVMISTDKAVNPTNIMGATKRVCEMLIQTLNQKNKTEFVAVRFGNVLGSNGSVIPLFKKQIKDGGPLTVTHEEVTRYFMTIPEASKLVIQAGAMAKGGEIFILDMGKPTKIIDLASDLIKLSGLEPNVDIDIEVTGLRPGEKLYEELLLKKDNHIKTSNKKIFIEKPISINKRIFLSKLNKLKDGSLDEKNIYNKLDDIIETFEYDGKNDKVINIR
ncbi:polysaccharide biosynthesis protein [Helicovermis profundi]|uniref:Nucleoside-diphosphate sugar epimerase/dehydratase n=1 Tax=Helicovermis profundi TaxID=3065157 RepID=A0AAU9EE28_9FIRM|nr:nucleoside-diphosphate sugar epimerase/dehydratase [Clostridia bacterium S502]